MPEGIKVKRRSYYWKAIKQHRRTVALLVSAMFTIPLFVFSALPPVEVVEEIPQETIEEVPIPIEVPVNVSVEVPIEVNQTVEVEVNKTIEVEVNVTREVIVNTTIGVNVTEGTSIFLEPQPAPPLIDSDIIFCIDTSGSMDANRMPIAITAIKTVLELINQSNSLGLSNDRVGLVTFAGERDWDWTNDAVIQVELDFISNQTHLIQIINATEALTGSGWTDAWAGLNSSLDLLLNSPRNGSALKSILFLTDGAHNTGPWGLDVEAGNYTGFMQFPANFSSNFYSERENGTNSQSPVVVARKNNVKIYSIGLFEGAAYGFDENFLRDVSLDPDYGTFGEFFVGNDTLSLIESFLRARDSASGWTTIAAHNTTIVNNGTTEILSVNVTQDIRRFKWDLLWNDSSIDCNLTAINPNGTIIDVGSNVTEDIILITIQQQKSVIFDFPMHGMWQFNISWSNVSVDELVKSRISAYEPPIFIESVNQMNMSNHNHTRSNLSSNPDVSSINSSDSTLWAIKSRISDSEENFTSIDPSVLFMVNVTNKNPLFVYHNITPILLANFTGLNVTHSWEPSLVPQLETNDSVSFIFNLTFLEPTFLQGNIYFKVNCTEGYYDAYTQAVSLDYRVTTENITVETHTENQTITVFENRTITVMENSTVLTVIYSNEFRLENQTTFITGTTKTIKHAEILQVVDTGKWIGLIATFALLMSFLLIYVRSKQLALKNLTLRFRSRLFPDQSALETALQREGIQIAPNDLERVISDAADLDQLGDTIYDLTSTKLSPEDLIRVASGTDIDKIAQRLSIATGIGIDEIIARLRGAKTIDELIKSLGLDSERFLDIIARDEDVINFQARIKGLIPPSTRIVSGITSYDDLDVNRFRLRLKHAIRRRRRIG